MKQTQPIIATIVQDTKTIIINKNKDGYKNMCIIHSSPFLYAHSLCCSPPNYVQLLSPFLSGIAKSYLWAFSVHHPVESRELWVAFKYDCEMSEEAILNRITDETHLQLSGSAWLFEIQGEQMESQLIEQE